VITNVILSGLGIALGTVSLFAVIMTGVTAALCCKLRSRDYTDANKLVHWEIKMGAVVEGACGSECTSPLLQASH
jgi:hypothetical protein